MSANVAILPTERAVDRAWQHYVDLCLASEGDPALRVSAEHQTAIVRAWVEWRDLFLACDGRAACS